MATDQDENHENNDPGSVLLLASAAGDHRAFRSLYQLEAPLMMALALRLTGHRDRAEDAVQDAFVQAWHKARQFRPERGTARAWLYSLLRHRIISLHRRERPVMQEPLPTQDWPDPGPGPEQCFQSDHQQRALLQCLRLLQGERRRPIMMAFYHGLTYEQIADQLAEPLGTVKSRVRAGLRRLQECLRP